MAEQQKIITVFGSSRPKPESQDYIQAEAVGRTLAEAGFAVMTGGYFGTMEAISKGASEAGGHVIGVTATIFEGEGKRSGANPYVKELIQYDNLADRLVHLVKNCHAAVALPGGLGTLSEITLTWSFIQTSEIDRMPLILFGEDWGKMMSFGFDPRYYSESDLAIWQTARTPTDIVTLIRNWEAGA